MRVSPAIFTSLVLLLQPTPSTSPQSKPPLCGSIGKASRSPSRRAGMWTASAHLVRVHLFSRLPRSAPGQSPSLAESVKKRNSRLLRRTCALSGIFIPIRLAALEQLCPMLATCACFCLQLPSSIRHPDLDAFRVRSDAASGTCQRQSSSTTNVLVLMWLPMPKCLLTASLDPRFLFCQRGITGAEKVGTRHPSACMAILVLFLVPWIFSRSYSGGDVAAGAVTWTPGCMLLLLLLLPLRTAAIVHRGGARVPCRQLRSNTIASQKICLSSVGCKVPLAADAGCRILKPAVSRLCAVLLDLYCLVRTFILCTHKRQHCPALTHPALTLYPHTHLVVLRPRGIIPGRRQLRRHKTTSYLTLHPLLQPLHSFPPHLQLSLLHSARSHPADLRFRLAFGLHPLVASPLVLPLDLLSSLLSFHHVCQKRPQIRSHPHRQRRVSQPPTHCSWPSQLLHRQGVCRLRKAPIPGQRRQANGGPSSA